MALVKCKECGTEVSTSAKQCPKCGSPSPTKSGGVLRIIAIVIGALVAVWWIFGGGAVNNAGTGAMMDQIQTKVASDAVDQYNIASQQGDRMQICVQAGLVAAAYLQAKDTDNYNQWKAREKTDCRAAGIDR